MSITIIIAVGGFLLSVVTTVVMVTRSQAKMEAKIEALPSAVQLNEHLNKLNLNIEQIRVSLYGIDNSNGLRGELRELKEAVRALQDREHE